jgi:hypothetical protein
VAHSFIVSIERRSGPTTRSGGAFSNRLLRRIDRLCCFTLWRISETCIATVERALLLAERVAVHSDNPEIERTLRRLLDSDQRCVRPFVMLLRSNNRMQPSRQLSCAIPSRTKVGTRD